MCYISMELTHHAGANAAPVGLYGMGLIIRALWYWVNHKQISIEEFRALKGRLILGWGVSPILRQQLRPSPTGGRHKNKKRARNFIASPF